MPLSIYFTCSYRPRQLTHKCRVQRLPESVRLANTHKWWRRRNKFPLWRAATIYPRNLCLSRGTVARFDIAIIWLPGLLAATDYSCTRGGGGGGGNPKIPYFMPNDRCEDCVTVFLPILLSVLVHDPSPRKAHTQTPGSICWHTDRRIQSNFIRTKNRGWRKGWKVARFLVPNYGLHVPFMLYLAYFSYFAHECYWRIGVFIAFAKLTHECIQIQRQSLESMCVWVCACGRAGVGFRARCVEDAAIELAVPTVGSHRTHKRGVAITYFFRCCVAGR